MQCGKIIVPMALFLAMGTIVNCGNEHLSGKNPADATEPGGQVGQGDGKDRKGTNSQALRRNKFRVAIVDDGFDTSLPFFEGKIVAKATLKCSEQESGEIASNSGSYALRKKAYIAGLKSQEDKCQLVEDLEFTRSQSFAEIEDFRDDWNRKIQTKNAEQGSITSQISKKIQNILAGESQYNYHGTQVASFIAYKNSNVEFVLIQFELAKSSEDLQRKISCKTQAEFDFLGRLLTDSYVIAAVKSAQISPIEKKIDDFLVQHDVDFINTSFGKPATKALEQIFARKGCGRLSLGKFIAAQGELDRIKQESQIKRGLLTSRALTISAFGNEGIEVNTPEASDRCSQHYTINVGALDVNGDVASFSNRGKCGDVYIGGEDVISVAPQNFLYPISGTSFSSPLFIRYLTQSLKGPQDSYEDVYEVYRGSGKKLKGEEIPRELFFRDSLEMDALQLTGSPNGGFLENSRVDDLGRIMSGRSYRGIRFP